MPPTLEMDGWPQGHRGSDQRKTRSQQQLKKMNVNDQQWNSTQNFSSSCDSNNWRDRPSILQSMPPPYSLNIAYADRLIRLSCKSFMFDINIFQWTGHSTCCTIWAVCRYNTPLDHLTCTVQHWLTELVNLNVIDTHLVPFLHCIIIQEHWNDGNCKIMLLCNPLTTTVVLFVNITLTAPKKCLLQSDVFIFVYIHISARTHIHTHTRTSSSSSLPLYLAHRRGLWLHSLYTALSWLWRSHSYVHQCISFFFL